MVALVLFYRFLLFRYGEICLTVLPLRMQNNRLWRFYMLFPDSSILENKIYLGPTSKTLLELFGPCYLVRLFEAVFSLHYLQTSRMFKVYYSICFVSTDS